MISGATRLAAVIGDPVRHSLSPAIHNAAFEALGLDWVYLALPVAAGRGADAVAAMRTFAIDGLSVTMPHKADVAAAADGLTAAAEALGVANCLFWQDGRLMADSTDGDGFVRAYEAEFGRTLVDRRVLVAGAGGAAKSIIEAVGRAGSAEVLVVNRSNDAAVRAAALAERATVASPRDVEAVASVDVVVNATAVGMIGGPDPEGIPIAIDGLRQGQDVVDIVYQPRVTPLLHAAQGRGAAIGGGVAMLVHQAALAFRHWTGVDPPVDVMTRAATSS